MKKSEATAPRPYSWLLVLISVLPVVMLTTSQAEEDRLKSYALGANAYIVKPIGFENFSEAIRAINLFWKLVELPGGNR